MSDAQANEAERNVSVVTQGKKKLCSLRQLQAPPPLLACHHLPLSLGGHYLGLRVLRLVPRDRWCVEITTEDQSTKEDGCQSNRATETKKKKQRI